MKEEERSPESTESSLVNTMKKVFDEHAIATFLRLVSPTISRIWHVGENDLGSTTDPDKSNNYKPDQLPTTVGKRAREQRYLNRHKAKCGQELEKCMDDCSVTHVKWS
ncbi:hypothetical protein OS493_038499 [Desmophyllum pertusum]|uniref:Uncharacterized protein n=1 Tax=Desmophyllum pertusum TaxID=174260 RepID=A0A9X0D038_9CNID|nr:hypothetical protein OS493_038499 [Desmophyllum pertusum]